MGGCAKRQKAVKIAFMMTHIKTSEIAWFDALFIAANYSSLTNERHTFFGRNRQCIPQALRYTLR